VVNSVFRCGLYNVTIDEYGHAIRPNYTGGLYCCYDETQCKLKEGFESVTRTIFLKYTVKWVDWEPRIIPVKIYILDITDPGTNSHESCMV
jgi:Stress up-regulated Nod 19